MKPRNRLSRVMALLLSFAMIISMAPYNWLAIYAEDGDESPTETAQVVDETVDDPEAAAEDTATGAEKSVKEAPQAQEQPHQEAAPPQDEKSDADADATAPADEEAAEDAAADADGTTAPEDEAAPSDDEEEKSATAVVQTVKVGGAEITAEYSSDVFKDDVRLKAREIKAETKEFSTVEKAAVKLLDEPKTEAIFAYDITFETSDGTELEPGDAVKISIRLNKAPADKALNDLNLVHISDNGKAEKLDDARINDDATKVVFESDAFSVYVVTAKDATSYEVDGTGYDSLSAAINAVNGSGTIWVTEDKSEGSFTVPAGKDIAIKTSNGATLSVSGQVTVDGTLEINDGITINNTVNYGACVTVNNGGSLAIKGGTITSDRTNGSTISISSGGTITEISGGTISVNRNGSSAIRGGAIKLITGDALIEATGNANTRAIKGTHIDQITGGTIKCTTGSAIEFSGFDYGHIGTISGGYIIAGSGSAITGQNNYSVSGEYQPTIGEITGTANIQGTTAGVSVSATLSGIGTISGGTITATSGPAVTMTRSGIATISGGTLSGTTAGLNLAGNATYTPTVGEISGGTFVATGTTGGALKLGNYSEVTSITGGTYNGYAGIYLSGATAKIDQISGGEYFGTSYGLYLYSGTITAIEGGRISSASYGISVTANGKIDTISGGDISGNYGIYNQGTIESITAAGEGDLVLKGTSQRAIHNTSTGKINSLNGPVILIGNTYAIYNSSGVLNLESGLTAAMGDVRTQATSNNDVSHQLNNTTIPSGYHVSQATTSVSGQSGKFHFLVKDNTVLYDGNGSVTTAGKTMVGVAAEGTSATIADNNAVGFPVPAGYDNFAGWNTAADGTGTAHAAGDNVTMPASKELMLYAQWAASTPYNITVKHSFDYLVDPNVTSQFTWRSNPIVSENFEYEGANDISPEELWDKSTDITDYILYNIQHAGAGISVQGEGSLTIGALMDVDLAHPATPYPFTYKLTSVTVDGTEVTDLTSTINFTEAAEVVFNYELVPIDLEIDFDANLTGVYKGTAYTLTDRGVNNMALTGSDGDSYLVYPTQRLSIGIDMPWTVQGSRIVVGTTELMPSNPYASYGWTTDLKPSSWAKNTDGTYAVPGVSYNVEYFSSRFHGVNYSDPTLPDDLFNVSYKPVTITVTPKALTVTVIDQTYIANGSPQGEDNAGYTNIKNENADVITDKLRVEGLASGDYIRSFKLNGTETAVGVYNDKIEVSDVVIGCMVSGTEYGRTNNYTINLVSGKLTIESNETTYTVKHLQQNVNDDSYTEVTADRQTIDAAIGDEVTPAVKTYEGFKSPAAQTVTVKRDNATVVEYRYDRNIVTVTLDPTDGTLPDEKKAFSGKYGAQIGDIVPGGELPTPANDNAEFLGWFKTSALTRGANGEITEDDTMPSTDTTYYARWESYKYENVDTREKFTRLQDAIDAAPAGSSTIRPLKDYTDTTNATVPAGKNITLDTSEGHTLTINGALTVNGGLTIGDGLTVQNSGVTMMVNNSGTFTMNGGKLISSGSNGLTVASGGTAAINDFDTIEGTHAAISCSGTITKIDGEGTVRSTDSSNSRALWVQPGGHVGEISGGTFEVPDGNECDAIFISTSSSTPPATTIDLISGGVFKGGSDGHGLHTVGQGHVKEISGGTFTGGAGLWATGGINGTTMTISGGTFNGGSTSYGAVIGTYGNGSWDITGGTFMGRTGLGNFGVINTLEGVIIEATEHGIENNKTITLISEDTKVTAGLDAVYNQGAIKTIEDGSFDGGRYGLNNGVKVESITGGTIAGDEAGVFNTSTIDKISGGEITGPVGISNESGATITSIDVANEGDLVVTGTDGAAVLNDGGTIEKISGRGIYIGTDNAIKSTGGTVTLEPGIDEIIGFGRYHTSGNTPASQLDGVEPPEGYHMVRSVTDSDVEGQDDPFRFLIKNNTILYNGNSHEIAPDSDNKENTELGGQVPVSYGENDAKASDNGEDVHFKENGKTFIGWTTTSDGKNAKCYKAGSTVEFEDEQFTDTILYAQWGVKLTYKVADDDDQKGTVKKNSDSTQNSEDGVVTEVIAPNADVASGFGLATEPKGATAATKDDQKYKFVKWTDADDNEVSKNASYAPGEVPESNAVYEAHFTNLWDVTFDADGGAPEPEDQKVVDGENAEKPATDPEKTGHDFAGWFEIIADTVEGIASDAFDFATEIHKDTDLKAKWNINQYTINFDSNGGSPVDPITQDYDTDVTAPEDPTREGYTFDGWDKKIPSKMPAENTTITAQWTPIEYKITYDLDGGSLEKDVTNPATYTIESEDITLNNPKKEGYTFNGWTGTDLEKATKEVTIEKGSTGDRSYTATWEANKYTVKFDKNTGNGEMADQSFTYDVEQALSANEFEKEGYTFTGWNTKADGTGEAYKDKQSVKNLTAENGATVTLYAQWKVNQYTITFDSNGGSPVDPITQDYGTDVTAPEDPTRDGYTFGGWEPELPDKMPAENTTVKAKWTPIEYKITYDLDGGSLEKDVTNPATYTIESDDITLNNPKKEGYTFNGWTGTDLDGATKEVTIKKGSTGDRSYTAKWKVNQYKVTYKYLGEVPAGASDLPADALHDFGSKVKVADPAAAPGYTFSGWSKEDFTMPAEDVEITGTFTAKGDTPYKVEHYKEMTEDGKYQLAETESLTGRTGATATANPKTYEGFSLNEKAGGAVESGIIAADGSLVLKLFYDRNRYEITYDLNGGEYEGSTDDIVETYSYLTDITVHEAPTREGYEFLYWKGSEYQPGDSYTVTEDHLFTAQWEEVAEEPEEEEEEEAEEPEDTAKPDKARDKGVRTGDETDLMAIGGIFGASLLGLLAMIRRRKRGQQ